MARLNTRLAGMELSLPSETQWEFACGAGARTARYGGDLSELAWYDENSDFQTHPVGKKQPNGWGLYDMLGNVWEWCADEYRPPGADDASPSADRVIRGGAYDLEARIVRGASRGWLVPGIQRDYLGFRCAEFREGVEALQVEP